ncbi:MAG TPA: hypothetical protein VL326_13275, partial [Kofleriaceae bacterium]|nr:hypothetical protein [Kofleriaceae bacterium]
TITIDTTVAHRGAQSIKAHTPLRNAGQAGYAILLESQTFTATPATLWVRGWFRLSALPAGNNGMELIFAGQNPQPQQGDYVFMHAGDLGLYDQFDGTIMNNATVPPLNTWFCVVFQVTLATTATGVMKMTSDSQPPVTLNNVVTQSSPPIDLLQIGIGYASGNVNVSQPATDMWMDDILVSGSTLTCAD